MSDNCPKCGAPVSCVNAGGYKIVYKCFSAVSREGFWGETLECKTRQIAQLQAALARKDWVIRALAKLVADYTTCPAEWGEDGSPLTCKAADAPDLCDNDGTDCWIRWAEAVADKEVPT